MTDFNFPFPDCLPVVFLCPSGCLFVCFALFLFVFCFTFLDSLSLFLQEKAKSISEKVLLDCAVEKINRNIFRMGNLDGKGFILSIFKRRVH